MCFELPSKIRRRLLWWERRSKAPNGLWECHFCHQLTSRRKDVNCRFCAKKLQEGICPVCDSPLEETENGCHCGLLEALNEMWGY
jgi:hypothetical protein